LLEQFFRRFERLSLLFEALVGVGELFLLHLQLLS
jgi:hypothetical protein